VTGHDGIPRPPEPPLDLGVALLNMGGPWHGAGIRPFLDELFADREIIRLGPFAWMQPLIAGMIVRARLRDVIENYGTIGGSSPQLRSTVRQAVALERELARRGLRARVLPAMRYANPRAADALRAFRKAGARRVLPLTLYPQFSAATTGSSLRDFDRVRRSDAAAGLEFLPPVREYPVQAGLVEAVAGGVRAAVRRVSARERDGATILVSAHGLPRHFVDDGDPYVDQVGATMEALRARLRLPNPWRLSFQSRAGPVKWIGPDTDLVLRELGAEGCRAVVLVPVSFVSEHIETLYEIDILFAGVAREAGIGEFQRSRTPECDPAFIGGLADLVEERARVEVPA